MTRRTLLISCPLRRNQIRDEAFVLQHEMSTALHSKSRIAVHVEKGRPRGLVKGMGPSSIQLVDAM